jgi:hypothetical protein
MEFEECTEEQERFVEKEMIKGDANVSRVVLHSSLFRLMYVKEC